MADEAARPAVGIVGAGTMGAGIAQVALEAGWTVRLFDVAPGAVERARSRIWDGLLRRAAKVGGTTGVAVDPSAWAAARLDRLEAAFDLAEVGAPGVGLVIEAALEDLAAKRDVFAALDAVAPPATILATNTSALPVTRIAEATYRPERVLGLHFFNPAPVLRLVEVVSTPLTERSVVDRATAIIASWGKTAVHCTDAPGFIVNRVNRPFTLEPLRMLERGQATVEAIDGAVRSAGFPMGPFELMDLVGIDVNLAAARGVWEGLGRPERLTPSPIQERLVAAGRLGRKTDGGFYRYDRESIGGSVPDAPLASGIADGLEPEAIVERVILAIVNEAYRTLGEGIATADDIDLALRLGANHPFGPFEWAHRTGLPAVVQGLESLAVEDPETFRPAGALLDAADA